MEKKAIAFDLDGTLFQAHLLAVPAYQDTFARLQAEGVIQELPSEAELRALFGMTERDIWRKMLPGTSEETREDASAWARAAEQKYLSQGLGALFPGVIPALTQLSRQGFPLFVVSNGTEGYVKSVCRSFGLNPLVAGIYSAGEYKTETKARLLSFVLSDHGFSPGLMVGDRSSDIEAGLANGFTTVGCTYGYGAREELADAHHLVDDIQQILTLTGKE